MIERIVLHLSLIEGVGPVTITRIVEHLPGDLLANLYAMSAGDIQQQCGIAQMQAHKIAIGLADLAILEHEYALCEKHACTLVTLVSDAYPAILKHIYAPPAVLYWRGSSPECDSAVAIVGSRQANAYGHRVIEKLVPSLVKAGCSIISGGALGIDTMAHRVAVQAGGHTTVVLGSGLLHLYPPGNRRLFETIIDNGGSLLSAFPLNTRALPGNFPARNRIIAGLARGTLVVQAAHKSGALITARYALDQGREVMAVPGPIDDPLSDGCHELIAQGATLITQADTILVCLGLVAQQSSVLEKPAGHEEKRVVESQATIVPLSLEDQLLLFCAQPRSIDELLVQTGLESDRLIGLLFELQLAGCIEQDFSGKWQTRS